MNRILNASYSDKPIFAGDYDDKKSGTINVTVRCSTKEHMHFGWLYGRDAFTKEFRRMNLGEFFIKVVPSDYSVSPSYQLFGNRRSLACKLARGFVLNKNGRIHNN